MDPACCKTWTLFEFVQGPEKDRHEAESEEGEIPPYCHLTIVRIVEDHYTGPHCPPGGEEAPS